MVIEQQEAKVQLRWSRDPKATVATLVTGPIPSKFEELKARKKKSSLKIVKSVVPSRWKFLEKIEEERKRFEKEEDRSSIDEFIGGWQFADYLELARFPEFSLAKLETRILCPRVPKMSEESLRLIGSALEKLSSSQQSQQWAKYLKSPEAWKPESRDAEVKTWPDWRFAFVNYVKSIDPKLSELMDEAEKKAKGSYKFDEMSPEAQTYANRLYNLLISYVKMRPLKLIRQVEHQDGFMAWKILIEEMQPSTRQRSLAIMTQLSRIQFQSDKSIGEQLPMFEALVNEYERISENDYSDDAKVAAVLLAVPGHLKQHLQLWVNEATTYESLKNKIMQLEAMNTKWETTNVLAMPNRAGTLMDETTPPWKWTMFRKGTKARKEENQKAKRKENRKARRKARKEKAEETGKVKESLLG